MAAIQGAMAWWANFVFGTRRAVARFERRYPETVVHLAAAAKGRQVESGSEARHELNWAVSRRATLLLTDTDLRCGDWVIDLDEVQRATLQRSPGGCVLVVETTSGPGYHFGLMWDESWLEQAVLDIDLVEGTLVDASPTFSVVRIVVILFLGWALWNDMANGSIGVLTLISTAIGIWLAVLTVQGLKRRSDPAQPNQSR